MDRNTVIGFLVLGLLVVGYSLYNKNSEENYLKHKALRDSLARKEQPVRNSPDTTASLVPLKKAQADTGALLARWGIFSKDVRGTLQQTTLDNGVLRITFSNLGGIPERIRLKKYKTYGGAPLILKGMPYDRLSLEFPNANTLPVKTRELYFQDMGSSRAADGSQTIRYRLNTGNPRQYLQFSYTLHPNNYLVDWHIRLRGLDRVIPEDDHSIQLVWQTQANHQEMDIKKERLAAQVYFRDSQDQGDYFSLIKTKEDQLSKPIHWISCKQEFFNTALIDPDNFSSVQIQAQLPQDTSKIVARTRVILNLPFQHESEMAIPLSFYFGPNDYTLLHSYGIGLEDVVPLGYGMYAFVKYINRWVVLPVFLLLGRLIGNWGIVIVLLTIVLRLLISPLTYKSYVSQAKMKALKPELDQLREKYKDDQQKFGMEQMKLFRSAGVSPLGGCVPMLLQIPIFFSLYSLFMSALQLRQQHFLWVKDLSTYDAIYTFHNFSIPIYGDHISLLTILMTLTSLFMAFYNRNLTAANAGGQNAQILKYMPFVLPIFFLGFFNSLAAGLTLYYLVSNIITILIQFVIQNYIIDEKKIHQQIQENKKKPLKASKWQQRLDEMQKQQASGTRRKF